jgi:hypothetical protein
MLAAANVDYEPKIRLLRLVRTTVNRRKPTLGSEKAA